MRVVIDTNVLLSGLLWHGAPHTLIEHARDGIVTLVSSSALLGEFADVIMRQKFQAILTRSAIQPHQLVRELRLLAEIVDPQPLPMAVSRDPDDDMVLGLAVAAHADLLITGDADLLAITQYEGIRIVTPATALRIIALA